MNRKSVMLCLKEFKEGGIENALFDAPGCCRNAEITDEEKTWIINTTYRRPVDFGYAAKTWTYTKLISHIHKTAEAAGYTRLSTIHKSMVDTILSEAEIKPHKITYYCKNRDLDSVVKMHNVLLMYKQLSIQFDEESNLIPFEQDGQAVYVLSYDEKPDLQAIGTTTENLRPDEHHSTINYD